MVQVIKKGLDTSVQDYPWRIGTLNQGFPSSGPMDSWSFRLANVLVENEAGTAVPASFSTKTFASLKDQLSIGPEEGKPWFKVPILQG